MATGLENLKVHQIATRLEAEVHKLTSSFPKDERFRSVDQLRRSSSSVSNNIAEGYHRRSVKDKLRVFVDIVKAEAEETRQNLINCRTKGFHQNSDIIEEYTVLLKMISGYVRFLRTMESGGTQVTSKLKPPN